MPIFAATTTPTAATHSHSLAGLIAVAVVVLLITLAIYLTACWLVPFTACRHPHSGKPATANGGPTS